VFKVYYDAKFGVGSLPQWHSTMQLLTIARLLSLLALCSM